MILKIATSTALLLASMAALATDDASTGSVQSTAVGAAQDTHISTEAVPANNPSLRHNPVAVVQSAAAAKANLQTNATPGQLHEHYAYFDYNRSDLHTEDIPMLRVHASYLLAHPGARIKLVGYADQRGGSAYNLALGNQRAHAVRDYFLAQGVKADQIELDSLGQQDPIALEKTEPSMAKNRRVDIVYLDQRPAIAAK